MLTVWLGLGKKTCFGLKYWFSSQIPIKNTQFWDFKISSDVTLTIVAMSRFLSFKYVVVFSDWVSSVLDKNQARFETRKKVTNASASFPSGPTDCLLCVLLPLQVSMALNSNRPVMTVLAFIIFFLFMSFELKTVQLDKQQENDLLVCGAVGTVADRYRLHFRKVAYLS